MQHMQQMSMNSLLIPHSVTLVLQANSVGITWTLCWWAINYSPGGVVARLHSQLPVRMVTKVRLTSPAKDLVAMCG